MPLDVTKKSINHKCVFGKQRRTRNHYPCRRKKVSENQFDVCSVARALRHRLILNNK